MNDHSLPTRQKALTLNLDAKNYGTFAEIGGGQEVSRWFFSVGGAAGTVAETVSAYDKAVSDRLYGHATRYVSRERLRAMLEQEFNKLREGLDASQGNTKCFFAFADTVATRSFQTGGKGRSWLGIRFQTRPREEPSEIIIHAHLLDSTATGEQAALGILGVNLIYAAFVLRDEPAKLIASLMDDRADWPRFSKRGPSPDESAAGRRRIDCRCHVHGRWQSSAASGRAI